MHTLSIGWAPVHRICRILNANYVLEFAYDGKFVSLNLNSNKIRMKYRMGESCLLFQVIHLLILTLHRRRKLMTISGSWSTFHCSINNTYLHECIVYNPEYMFHQYYRRNDTLSMLKPYNNRRDYPTHVGLIRKLVNVNLRDFSICMSKRSMSFTIGATSNKSTIYFTSDNHTR